VAAIDHATGTDWTPRQLLATAHELLTAATPDDSAALRPDQIAAALAWRIDALLQHTPTPDNPSTHRTASTPQPSSSQSPDDHKSIHMPEPRPPDHAADAASIDIGAVLGEAAELFRSG